MSAKDRLRPDAEPVTGTRARQGPGVVKLRLGGARADIDTLAGLLNALPEVAIVDGSAPYENRRDPGERVYLTVCLTPPAGGGW